MRFKRVTCLLLAVAATATAAAAAPESLVYLFAGNTSIYTERVARTKGNLTALCPDYFELSASGHLAVTARADGAFIAEMQKTGAEVVPFLSNHWDMTLARAALNNRAALANEIALAVMSLGADGVDIDIENINHNDRAAFTDFIRLLRAELGPEKILSVAVPANPWGWTIGWHGAYDYAALAKYADHLFIMAYDESYQGGPEGPVASYPFVRKSVEYALRYTAPEKIMLGIPFYGRYWPAGGGAGGKALTVANIRSLTARYPTSLTYDTGADSPRAVITIPRSAEETALWGGKSLGSGVYTVWYENETSWQKKLNLVREFGLKGAGAWALGQEPEDIWGSYRMWLQGLPFNDIYGHWAEQYITDMYDKGVVTGIGNIYAPQRSITRAEALVVVARLAELEPEADPQAFGDVRGHWAAPVINTAAKYGIAQGHEGKFRPEDPVTREEFAVLLMRVLNLPQTVDATARYYIDVSAGKNPWSIEAITELYIHGVLSPPADGRFRPKSPITRGEVAKMAAVAHRLPRGLKTAERQAHPFTVEPR
ncbi:S-layer homology domain-containing protein [Oscillospiraceae bacterium OttesenSCG-928-F05]|nr:S-layer homology domain-containing protein [Oscillospiraceae bacterium OttesenSCG-928-F05]